MDRDELRSLVNKYREDNKEEITESLRRELAGMIVTADTRCENAAKKGLAEVVVFSIPDYREDLIDIPENCRASRLDDERKVIQRAISNLKNLGIANLRGNVAELRDYLLGKKLSLSMQIRSEGNTCNSKHNVWDLIAHW